MTRQTIHRSMLVLLLASLAATAQALGQLKEIGAGHPGAIAAQHLTAELLADPVIRPGAEAHLGLSLKLEPGWHVYWLYPGDSGQAPEVSWVPQQGVSPGPMQFPAPSRLPLGPLTDYGYEGAVVFPFALATNTSLPTGPRLLQAHVRWLVCREVCLPGRAFLGVKLNASDTIPATTHPLIAAALQAEPEATPQTFAITAGATRSSLELTIDSGQRETSAEFYPLDDALLRNAAPQVVEPDAHGLRLRLERADASDTLPTELKGVLRLSGHRSYNVTVPVHALAAPSQQQSRSGLGLALLLALAGGVVLNLMPCVFPVLFLKALSLVHTAAEDRSRQRAHGWAYTAGILCSFWLLVSALLGLRTLGREIGWGYQLQSPGFVVTMIFLIFLLGLSLAGLFDIGLGITGAGDALTRRSGLTGSFFTGVLATVVATPCTAPLMGAAVGFALTQSAFVTFTVFTALAVGLASPYLLLTMSPGLASKLPRPGRWMEILKQLTSIPLFLTVIWLVWVYARLSAGTVGEAADHVARLLAAMLLLTIAGWTLGKWPARRLPLAFGAVLTATAFAVTLAKGSAHQVQWHPFSVEALAAAQKQGKPVFVDFTAAWCLSCQFNERTVLTQQAVQNELEHGGYVLLRADWTQYDPGITAALTGVGRSGVPTYVIFSPHNPGSPQVLPELLTRNIVLDAIRRGQS